MPFLEKGELWRQTSSFGGISKFEFENYFYGMEMAGALLLSHPVAYDHPFPIEKAGLVRPPQSFCYLSEEDE